MAATSDVAGDEARADDGELERYRREATEDQANVDDLAPADEDTFLKGRQKRHGKVFDIVVLLLLVCLFYQNDAHVSVMRRGGSRLVCWRGEGVSVSRSYMLFYLRTGGGTGTGRHVSFYLQKD